MNRKLILLVALSLATMTSSAQAHHSHIYFYDQCRIVTVEGRVDRVEWKDPHSLLRVTLDDGSTYTIDWKPLAALTSERVIASARASIVPGARIAVAGSPIRTLTEIRQHFPDFMGDVNPSTLDPRTIRRVDGAFSWERPNPTATPDDCGGN